MQNNDNSSLNTVLIVVLLLVVVGLGVWWLTRQSEAPVVEDNNTPGLNVDVNSTQ